MGLSIMQIAELSQYVTEAMEKAGSSADDADIVFLLVKSDLRRKELALEHERQRKAGRSADVQRLDWVNRK